MTNRIDTKLQWLFGVGEVPVKKRDLIPIYGFVSWYRRILKKSRGIQESEKEIYWDKIRPDFAGSLYAMVGYHVGLGMASIALLNWGLEKLLK